MKMYLAGFMVTWAELITIREPCYLLESYYYIEMNKKRERTKLFTDFAKKKPNNFILDSGAFTLLNTCRDTSEFIKNLDSYIEGYIKFIKENNIKQYIEMDIDPIVGYERVKQIRNHIEKSVGRQSIPVWHKSRGLDEWERLTKEYKYIALGGIATKEIRRREYKKLFTYLLRVAKRNNCKVHGLGFTQTNILQNYDFYSVDSTSWTGCVRFGRVAIYSKGKMISKRLSTERRLKSDKATREKLLIIQIEQWIKYQKFLMNKNGVIRNE